MDRRTLLRSLFGGTASLFGFFGGSLWLFLRQAKFGAPPEDSRLERILKSPSYRNGAFQNLLPTPMMTGDHGSKAMRDFIFNRNKRTRPVGRIPSIKCDLRSFPTDQNFMVWFGHSSYFIQLDGKRLLVDPVLSGRASPLSFTTKAFDGTDPYSVEDIPDIDYLFISHDHWDHLDYETITRLRPRVKRVICGLGVGAHMEKWGYATEAISEGDWGETVDLGDGFTAHIRTARHFSGRDLHRNQTLWVSFALKTSTGYKVFLGGDGGYGPHFKDIGNEFGGFDLALLEDGQYDKAWAYVHMMPEETLKAAEDLRATHIFPVHNSKFCISNHDWDAPLRTITSAAGRLRPRILTPMIGQVVPLKEPEAESSEWWTRVT
jgi:L-ascorbate metabolism protein UlaG (beta-lactamase superfamily)